MRTEYSLPATQQPKEQARMTETLSALEEKCKNCNPLSPIACVTSCGTWKLKNEFRRIHEKAKNPHFSTKLLNTLKNKRRLQILAILSRGRYSIEKLQHELGKLGYQHSQETMTHEYIEPLITVGLVQEEQNQYYPTRFGNQIHSIIGEFNEIEDVLPPHSECYEEQTLRMLLSGPKTFEELESLISSRSTARVLQRLQEGRLIETDAEKDYVFFFRTQRDPSNDDFSPTEERAYESISAEGISARKLALKTRISLRRTYKYLRRLKGKKLVFTRKRPKCYSLTTKGDQLAKALEAIHRLIVETVAATTQLTENNAPLETQIVEKPAFEPRKKKMVAPLTVVRHANRKQARN
jgi:predicted transcriptional regulator